MSTHQPQKRGNCHSPSPNTAPSWLPWYSTAPVPPRFSLRRSDSTTDVNKGPRLVDLQALEQNRNQRRQINKSGAARHEHKNCKRQDSEILLILKVLIRGDQGIERSGCRLQERTVLYPGPPHALHRTDLMAHQQLGQPPRQRFVKQQAHAPTRLHAPTPAQPAPVRARLTGSRLEIDPDCHPLRANRIGS